MTRTQIYLAGRFCGTYNFAACGLEAACGVPFRRLGRPRRASSCPVAPEHRPHRVVEVIGGVVTAMFRTRFTNLLLVLLILSLSCDVAPNPQNANDGNGNGTDDPVLVENPVRARVRNESTNQVDVTLRFLNEQELTHLAFVRVPPETITTISGPESEFIELSGVNEQGEALASAQLKFGIDFDLERTAEYVVKPGNAPPDEPGHPIPPTLSIADLKSGTVTLGGPLEIRWSDTGSFGALVSFFLRPTGNETATPVPISPAIGVALDGMNDSLVTVVEGVNPGEYEVLGRIDDGDQTSFAVSSNTITVVRDPQNVAPTISILSPKSGIVLSNGDPFAISWIDDDPDDNATVEFSLAPADGSGIGLEEYVISPPIAENSDKLPADAATLSFRDVLPGLYDIVARIDDGRLMGTARSLGVIRVVPNAPPAGNEIPSLSLLTPDRDFEVFKGTSFTVRWTDSDSNDNARIWLLLDADSQTSLLNGNEFVLASSFEEDPDGAADQMSVVVPRDIPSGTYRLVSVISDGLTQVISRAPALITVRGMLGGGGDTTPGGGNPGGGEGPQPTGKITLVPSAEVIDAPGEMITVVVTLDVPTLPRRSRILISNQAYGGDLLQDITPLIGPAANTKTFTIVVQSGLVPNSAWPRSFDLILEANIDGIVTTTRTSRPIWIRQEVEVVAVREVNYVCSEQDILDSEPNPFVGIEWTWYGGGFNVDELEEVAFWLSRDGAIPSNGASNNLHKMVAMLGTSPNQIRSERVSLNEIRGTYSNSIVIVLPAVTGLESGWYWLIPVIDPNNTARQLPAFAQPVKICQPVESASDGSPP